MGPLVVVDLDPGIDRLLGLGQAGERPRWLEQLPPQGLVEPLHLPGGGRRADLGQAVGDPVVPQDALEQHLHPAWRGEAAGELDPIVGQDLFGQSPGPQAVHQRLAHRPAGRLAHQVGDHAIARVVVDPGDQLGLDAVLQPDPTHDVHLPQRHRRLALPGPIVTAASATATLGVDQPVAGQDPPDRHSRRPRLHPPASQLIAKSLRPPARMGPPQLAHRCLDLGAGLVRAVGGPVRPVLEPGQPTRAIAAHPGVDALARDPIAGRDLSHTPPTQHLPHRVIALLDHAPLPQHPLGLLPTATDTASKQTERSCQASPETVKDLVKPTRPASPEPAHRALEGAGRLFSPPSRPALRAASGRPPARQRHDGHRGTGLALQSSWCLTLPTHERRHRRSLSPQVLMQGLTQPPAGPRNGRGG
jgi:hypothetical protein